MGLDQVRQFQLFVGSARGQQVERLLNAEPGLLTTLLESCRGWPSLTEVTVAGKHFLQEDSPHKIGQAIADWLPTLEHP